MDKKGIAKLALRFIILIGVVNLFADFTYEGARSINGAFLGSLGASAVAVGLIAGFGEFAGYGLRSLTGFIADKTHKYWLMVFVGYAINMFAVPALALAGNWPVAAVLMIAERTGRAIRKPSTETLLSFPGKEVGQGWAFGLNEALDQLGATIGPLIVALVLFLKGSYKDGYAVLLISAILCVGVLIAARLRFPKPENLEKKSPTPLQTKGFPRAYWLYVIAGALIAAGFVDFSLIAFHFQRTENVSVEFIPVLYAVAMAVAGISSLIIGRLFDRQGFIILILAFCLSAFFAPFVFLGKLPFAFVGMTLWGIGMGAQDSLLKATIANMVSKDKRSTAFGLFDTGFGMAWFVGSAIMGLLYSKYIVAVIVFSVLLQLAALPVFTFAERRSKGQR